MALPTPCFRVILTYRQGRAGWSELFYRNETSLANASKFTLDFWDAALNFRDPTVVLDFVRIQDLTNPRIATILRDIRQRAPVAGLTPDVASTAAIYELTTDAPVAMRRRIWLRGLVDSDVVRDETTGADKPSGNITNGMGAYWIQLKAHNMGIVGLIPIGAAPYVFTTIDSITVKSNQKITITTLTPFTLTTQNRVIISRLNPKTWPGLNGHWTAQNVTATSFDLQYSTQLAQQPWPQTTGAIRPEEYRFAGFGTTDPAASGFIAFNKHTTRGVSPFGRGRRRGVRLRSR